MNPLTWIFRTLIKGYQWIVSPVLPGSCRFYPTCSSYALQAINTHGPIKGAWLGAKRILRCHPWNDGGFDPVPNTDTDTNSTHSCTHTECTHPHHHA